MRRRIAPLVVCFALASSFAAAQAVAPSKTPAKPAATAPDRALLDQILTAWESMNPDNVAKYYDQAPSDVFYDIAPVKYQGFKQYAEGVKPMFATLSALKFTLNDDVAVHHVGSLAWSTATMKTAMTDKAGKTTDVDGRWTAIFQKKGARWVIVHDHFSAPAPEPPK